MTTKTQRLINRIEEKESFYDIAYLCEDFATFIDEVVEIADIHTPDLGWTDYDPPQGASSDELPEICNSLYARCLLAELGVEGFTPANEHKLIKS